MWWVLAPAYKTAFKWPEISAVINHSGLEIKKLSLSRVELYDLPDYLDEPGTFKYYESYPSSLNDSEVYSRIIQYPR
jgi:hypothetical protein